MTRCEPILAGRRFQLRIQDLSLRSLLPWLHQLPCSSYRDRFPASAMNFRISSLDMHAKKLMPIHLLQHLEALGRIAGSAEVEDQVWTLGIVIFFTYSHVAQHAQIKRYN